MLQPQLRKTRILFGLFLLLVGSQFNVLNAQDSLSHEDARLIQITPTRADIPLDGEWQATTDNGKTWRTVMVPGVVNGGTIIYEKRVFIANDLVSRKTFTLVLGTGGSSTEIRVNNEFVAIHNGAYSQFEVKIPDRLLQPGSENVIQIICRNELSPVSTVPLRQLAFEPKCYSGLFRHVYLEVKPPLYMDVASSKIEMGGENSPASVESDVIVYASDYSRYGIDSTATSIQLRAHMEIMDKASGQVVAKSADDFFDLAQNHNTKLHFTFQVQDVSLWSPSSPNLYEAVYYLSKGTDLLDECSNTIGFRTFQITKGKFLLNGNRTFIKSVNYVVDFPKLGAGAQPVDLEKDIAVIKTIGANAIRVVNYPPPPELLELCDRFGLMVFEELPIVDAPPTVIAENQYKATLQNYLSEIVSFTASHPCVVAISVGSNLDPIAKPTLDLISIVASVVHSETDKLVYYTPLTGQTDGIRTSADFVGIDLTPFNSSRRLKEFISNFSQNNPDVPYWISSVGIQTQLENHDGYSDPLSLEYQARYLVDTYDAIDQANAAGISINSFADWTGEVPHLFPNGHPYLYSFGLVSYWREKRPAFTAVRALFSDETLPTLPIGNYTETPPIIYVLLSTLLLVLITYLHYSRRWFRESATRAIFRPYNFYADIRDQRMISAFQTSTVLLLVAAGIAIYLSSLLYAFRDDYLLDRLLGILIPSDYLKTRIDYLIWHPAAFILTFTALCMGAILVTAIIIKIVSILVKIRLQMVSAFTVATWSTLPMAVLILADMILFRLLGDSSFVWGASIVFVALLVLSLFRLFHGIGVIYDLPTIRVGIIGSLLLIAAVIIYAIYYNGTDGVISYTKFLYSVFGQNRTI